MQNVTATGNVVLPLEVGTLVKLRSRVSVVYGMITGLRVPLPSPEPSDKDLKLIEPDLVGGIRQILRRRYYFERRHRRQRLREVLIVPIVLQL